MESQQTENKQTNKQTTKNIYLGGGTPKATNKDSEMAPAGEIFPVKKKKKKGFFPFILPYF